MGQHTGARLLPIRWWTALIRVTFTWGINTTAAPFFSISSTCLHKITPKIYRAQRWWRNFENFPKKQIGCFSQWEFSFDSIIFCRIQNLKNFKPSKL